MMQTRISAFFKPTTISPDLASTSLVVSACDDSRIGKNQDTFIKKFNREPRVIDKKRSYAQYHLELGQSDFLFHSCKVCGLSYSCGDEKDEKFHKTFHKDYYQGIQFKGWHNERVIPMPGSENSERIILIMDSDSSAKKHKVAEVIKLMTNDLCSTDEWLLHKLCKTYLFISRKRVVGCLVMEPIKKAHRIISNSNSKDSPLNLKTNSFARPASTILQFGNVRFQRKTMNKCSSAVSTTASKNAIDAGAVLCEEEAVSAYCGIRAIWVVPSCRNQRVATRLLDAARNSFLGNSDLIKVSECAFSAPTSDGRSFAVSYSGTESFLVYKDDDMMLEELNV
ncbi:chromosome transmission fidelity 7 [Zostera marina]|uniref:Chromosome transmission fidelity 7 n=1 Tax=Zostera marina TaxID=29655 RepID=A0A0K9NTS1_ZOSMR|nr:chromosome transmission fidelity 7 [Zostera marina]